MLKEVQTDVYALRFAARDSANEPSVSLSAGHHIVVASLGGKNACLIPSGRHTGNKARTLVLAHIAGGTIGQHLQSTLEHDIERHLICPCATTYRH